jgi:hypothetical protein
VANYTKNLDALAISQVRVDSLPKEIDKRTLSIDQKEALILFRDKWFIVHDWLVYFICQNGEGKLPHSEERKSKKFRPFYDDRKSFAFFVAKRFELCKQIALKVDISPYEEYSHLWIRTIREEQLAEIEYIIYPPALPCRKKGNAKKNLPGFILDNRECIKQLKKGEMPQYFYLGENQKHINPRLKNITDMCRFALRIVKNEDDDFECNYWEPYLKSYSRFINDIEKNSELKATSIDSEGDLVYRGQSKSIIKKPHEEKLTERLFVEYFGSSASER